MFRDPIENSQIKTLYQALPVLDSSVIVPNLCSEEQINRFERKLPGYMKQLVSSKSDLLDPFLGEGRKRNVVTMEWLKEKFADIGYENYDRVLGNIYYPPLEYAIFLGAVHLMQEETGPISF